MKRLIALFLALLLIASFTGCKDKETESKTSSVVDKSDDIRIAVDKGSIPEVKFALGTSIDELDEYYDELNEELQAAHSGNDGVIHDDDDIFMNISRGELSVTYEIGTTAYYYEKAKRENGVAVIVSLGDAYGFKQGTSRNDIEIRLAEVSTENLTAGEDELYFVQLSEALIIRYKKGIYQLDFYFNNNQLVATVLRNTKNWTI